MEGKRFRLKLEPPAPDLTPVDIQIIARFRGIKQAVKRVLKIVVKPRALYPEPLVFQEFDPGLVGRDFLVAQVRIRIDKKPSRGGPQ